MKRHASWIALGLLTGIALAWRVMAAIAIEFPSVDGVNYMTVARTLVRDGHLQFSTFPPGWPLLMSVPLFFLGAADGADVLHAAQIANVVFGTLAVPLVFVFLRHGFGAWTALAGATAIALLPDNVILSSLDLSEMSYLAVFVVAWILWHRERWWASGLVFGLAYLVRPEALIVFGVLCAVDTLGTRRLRWRPLAAALPFVIAYVVFVHGATGEWTLSGKTAFLDPVARAEGSAITRWLTNAATLLAGLPTVVGWPVALVAAWGAARRRGIELAAFLPLLLLPVFTFRMEARYWIPLVPFVLWFATAGAQDLLSRVDDARRRLARVAVAVVLFVGFCVAAAPELDDVGLNHEAFSGLREAGRWIAENSDPDDVVVGYKPYAAFWAGRPYAKLPRRDTALETVDRIRELGHEWLVINVFLTRSVTPQLQALVTPDALDSRLAQRVELVHIVRMENDLRQTTAIYRVHPFGR